MSLEKVHDCTNCITRRCGVIWSGLYFSKAATNMFTVRWFGEKPNKRSVILCRRYFEREFGAQVNDVSVYQWRKQKSRRLEAVRQSETCEVRHSAISELVIARYNCVFFFCKFFFPCNARLADRPLLLCNSQQSRHVIGESDLVRYLANSYLEAISFLGHFKAYLFQK